MFHRSVAALRYLLWLLIASAIGSPLLMLIVHDPWSRIYVVLLSVWFFVGLFLLIIRITHRVTAKRTLDEVEARRVQSIALPRIDTLRQTIKFRPHLLNSRHQ
jgi:hypothetical protein